MTVFGYYRGIFWRAQETVNISVRASGVLNEIQNMTLLNESLNLTVFHIMHTVRIKLIALQAAACAGGKRLGCL